MHTRLIAKRMLTVADVANKMYFCLLLPFTDVFCYFAKDIRGILAIVHYLALWVRQPASSATQHNLRLRVVVVTQRDISSSAEDLEQIKILLEEATTANIEDFPFKI